LFAEIKGKFFVPPPPRASTVTSYQIPVTSYQLPVTSYQLPVTSILDPPSYKFLPCWAKIALKCLPKELKFK